jgi:DNA-binding HxlR family transcriptional regulator
MRRKGYNEGCLAAHALDLIGDRWALLVLRELMLGPKRFGALKAGLPGIATNVLTQRLDGLEAAGLLHKTTLPPPANVPVYALTEAGLETREVIDALCRWGVRRPGHDPRKFISPAALMLSMRVMYRPAGAPDITTGFALGNERFTAHAGAEGFDVRTGASPDEGLCFSGDANRMAAVVYGATPLAQMLTAGAVSLRGAVALGQVLVDRFALRRD